MQSNDAIHIPEDVLLSLTVQEIKAELSKRNVHFASRGRKQELLDQLRSSLHLPAVADASGALARPRKKAPKASLAWNKNHPAWVLIYNEIKNGNIPLDINEMGPAEVYFNYHATLEFQAEGMEFGDTFAKRLEEVRNTVKKEIPILPWNDAHPARKLLYDELVDGAIPLDANAMGPAEVYYNYSHTFEFQLHGMEYGSTFQSRLKGLREQVSRDKDRASEDLRAFRKVRKNPPPPAFTHHGRPQWNGSEAQRLLEQDMNAGLHEQMRPQELWSMRVAYQITLSKDAFRWKIRQMKRTKKYLYTLKHDAEQKLKAYIKDLPVADGED